MEFSLVRHKGGDLHVKAVIYRPEEQAPMNALKHIAYTATYSDGIGSARSIH